MLRLILPLAAVIGGIAWGLSRLDSGAMQHIEAAVGELARGVGWSQFPPPRLGSPAVSTGGTASAGNESGARGTAPPRAFYNAPPEECHWEKIIDPTEGTMRCSVPERGFAPRR
jgi:hypothetical protein